MTVYDAAGKVVALGQLADGKVSPSGKLTCEFPIVAVGIPRGSNFYQVEISHRGKLSVSAADAESGEFVATLGS